MADIEILDEADGYPYSSHISINGYEVELDDLLLVFDREDSTTVRSMERIYGFTWGTVITHPIDGAVPAEAYDIDSLAERLEAGEMTVARLWHQDSYRIGEETVRRITLYRNYHSDGWQPVLVDETRESLSTDFKSQAVTICEDAGEVIAQVFENTQDVDQEAEHLREILLTAGFEEGALPTDKALSDFV